MSFTRREIHALIVLSIMILVMAISRLTLSPFTIARYEESAEYLSLVCIGFPLGIYVATDRERLKTKRDNP